MSNYFIDVLDNALIDIELSNALFTEGNTLDFFKSIKNSLNELQIKAKEYAVLQDSKLKSKDGQNISKYQKGIDDKIEYLLSLKSKNINSVDCYDFSKVRKTFPTMLDSLSNCIDGTLLRDIKTVKEADKAFDTFNTMMSDFSELLEKYSSETRLNVDTCISILQDSEDKSSSPKYLSSMFSTLNKLEHKLSELNLNEKDEVPRHHMYLVKKAITKYGKFAMKWINTLDKNYDIEFTR